MELVDVSWVRLLLFCRSLASGWVDRSSDPMDISSFEMFDSELSVAFDSFLRFLDTTLLAIEALAQSGTGYSRSN